jgi:hypothetical protein
LQVDITYDGTTFTRIYLDTPPELQVDEDYPLDYDERPYRVRLTLLDGNENVVGQTDLSQQTNNGPPPGAPYASAAGSFTEPLISVESYRAVVPHRYWIEWSNDEVNWNSLDDQDCDDAPTSIPVPGPESESDYVLKIRWSDTQTHWLTPWRTVGPYEQ